MQEGETRSLLQVFGVVLVMCAGIAIAWIDSRPTWDDAELTAAAVVVVAAAGSLAQVPAWLTATLAVGPLLVAELAGGAGVLLAVPFCAGWRLRWSVYPRSFGLVVSTGSSFRSRYQRA